MNNGNVFYVYAHKRKTDGSIFYVGKGSGLRHTDTSGRNPHWNAVAKKHGFTAEIVKKFTHEQCAFSFEKVLIQHYGLENLTNKTIGGEGVSGLRLTGCQRLSMSVSRLGHKKSDEHIKKIAQWHKGRKRGVETCLKISAKAKYRLSDPRNHWHATEKTETWYNEGVGIVVCSHFDLSEKTGLPIDSLKKVQSGVIFSYKGWKVAGVRNYSKRIGFANSRTSSQIYIWHKQGEDSFVGSRLDFANAKGINTNSLHPICSRKTKTYKGWNCRAL